MCFFFLTAPYFLLIFNSTSRNKLKDLEEDCLVFLLQATKTLICIYQCLERTRGNAWVVVTQWRQTKSLNKASLKVHKATEESKLGTDYGEVQHRQTFTQGVITQEQSLKLQLSVKKL